MVARGAGTGHLIEWAILGAIFLTSVALIAIHSYAESFLRPIRTAIIADTAVCDSMPRSRPSFASWSNRSLVATTIAFTLAWAQFGGVLDGASEHPAIAVVIAAGLTIFFAVPITLASTFGPRCARSAT